MKAWIYALSISIFIAGMVVGVMLERHQAATRLPVTSSDWTTYEGVIHFDDGRLRVCTSSGSSAHWLQVNLRPEEAIELGSALTEWGAHGHAQP